MERFVQTSIFKLIDPNKITYILQRFFPNMVVMNKNESTFFNFNFFNDSTVI